MADPYLLPNGILKNKLGITDASALESAEAGLSGARLMSIGTEGPKGAFDFERLKATHHYLFQDVYDWAGQVRTVELYKGDDKFTPVREIDAAGSRIFDQLRREDSLSGLARDEFAQKAADLLGEINQLHPFREGNGRTQREFIKALAIEAGHPLQFELVTRERMVAASILASAGKPEMMRRIFAEITDPRRVEPLREAIAFLDRSGFNWNDRYIATTTPGQEYSGVFVGRSGRHFMMRTDREIFVGNSADVPASTRGGDRIAFKATALDEPARQNETTDKQAQYTALQKRVRRQDRADGERQARDKERGGGRGRDD